MLPPTLRDATTAGAALDGFDSSDGYKKLSGGEARGRTSLIWVLACSSSRLATLLKPELVLSACGPRRKRKLRDRGSHVTHVTHVTQVTQVTHVTHVTHATCTLRTRYTRVTRIVARDAP